MHAIEPHVDPTPPARYDFRHRHRLAPEQLRPLRFLYDRFARNLGISLSAYLRVATEVQLRTVDPVTYDEFVASLPEQTVYYAVGVDPLAGAAALDVNPIVAHAMIDRMLGGRGAPAPVARALTDIEQRVVDNVVRLILEHMTEAWRHVAGVQFRIGRQETRPEMLDIVAPGETVIALRLAVRVGAIEGDVNLCLPTTFLDAMGSTTPEGWSDVPSEAERDALRGNLATVRPWDTRPRRLHRTPGTALPATELLQLAVGDVLSLGRPVETPVELYVSGTRKFTGTLTRSARGTGLTIRSVVGRPREGASGGSAATVEERGG